MVENMAERREGGGPAIIPMIGTQNGNGYFGLKVPQFSPSPTSITQPLCPSQSSTYFLCVELKANSSSWGNSFWRAYPPLITLQCMYAVSV